MRIKRHLAFRSDDNQELISYLNDHNLSYSPGEIISSCDIYEDDPNWQFLFAYVQKNELVCLSETIFSAKELSVAQWLNVRSQWRNGYPQPEEAFAYEHITYADHDHCTECGKGLVQVNPFRTRKEPKWGNRHFMMLNWVADELFVDDMVRDLFIENAMKGISFHEVLDKRGQKVLSQVHQMKILEQLQPGIVLNGESIDKVQVCSTCGTVKYHPSGRGMLSFRKEIFENAPDFVKTKEVFGWGHSASHEILVSQKGYRLMKQNKIDRGLVFEPVELV